MTTSQILQGDALSVLKTLESGSVQCCITSPPYFGLRDYGTAAWVGGDPDCDHKGNPMRTKANINTNCGTGTDVKNATAREFFKETCGRCGAIRKDGQLGLESTPKEYIANLVAVFAEVHRVLKKDGTLWLNLGDSYAGSGRGRDADGTPNPSIGEKQATNIGAITGRVVNPDSFSRKAIEAGSIGNWVKPPEGYKQKDLMGIPWRVAFALQEAGWYLRQDIIWAKPNPMPESVTDRCTKSHEYIFLLTKSRHYHYDHEAIKETASTNEGRPAGIVRDRIYDYDSKERVLRPNNNRGSWKGSTNRDRTAGNRNGEGASTLDGIEHRTRNKRSVWHVATQPSKLAHFATFPTKLVEPMILAGSREGDTILDPFNGTGTTGLVALRNNRNYIGIELNPEYIEISEERLKDVQPRLV